MLVPPAKVGYDKVRLNASHWRMLIGGMLVYTLTTLPVLGMVIEGFYKNAFTMIGLIMGMTIAFMAAFYVIGYMIRYLVDYIRQIS